MDQENMGWVPSMVKGPPVPPPSILEGVFRFLGGLRFFLGKIFKFWKNSRLLEDFFSGCFQKDFQILEDFQNSWEILRLFWETSRILGFSESCGIFRFQKFEGVFRFFFKKILTFFWIIMTPLTFETPMTTQVYDSTCYLWINSNTKPSQFLQFLSPDN